MLNLSAAVRIFVYSQPVDMRRSFDGLAALVEQHLGQNVESGHLFVFFNRRRDCVKLLTWEGDGLSIFYKRLEIGTFPALRPAATGESAAPTGVELRASDLRLLLEGVDLGSVKRSPRFRRAS